MGASYPPICLKLQEFWSKANDAACTLVIVFLRDLYLVTVVGQVVKTPPTKQKVS